MNPQLTCSQRQRLHSSVGRASHRYREVTGSNPVEVLNFFQASLRHYIIHCDDHFFIFISAVHIWFISYIINSQHCWKLHVASVCTSRCMLFRKVWNRQTFSPLQTDATFFANNSQHCRKLLRPFSRSLRFLAWEQALHFECRAKRATQERVPSRVPSEDLPDLPLP